MDSFTHLEVSHSITLAQLDLEDFQATDGGCQPCEALLPTSPHPHQESVASGGLQDAVDTTAEEGERQNLDPVGDYIHSNSLLNVHHKLYDL